MSLLVLSLALSSGDGVLPKKHRTEQQLLEKLLEDRIIFLGTVVNDDITKELIAKLLFLDADSHDDISLYINSVGGSVVAGLALIDTIRGLDSDVATYCVGRCASMAALVLAAGEKGKRHALSDSTVMIHSTVGGANATAEVGAALQQRVASLLSELSGRPLATIENDIARELPMNAEQSLDFGLVDKVVPRSD